MKITLKATVYDYIIRGEHEAFISTIWTVIVLHEDVMLECVGASWLSKFVHTLLTHFLNTSTKVQFILLFVMLQNRYIGRKCACIFAKIQTKRYL